MISEMGNRIVIRGMLWSSLVYIITIFAYLVYAFHIIDSNSADPFKNLFLYFFYFVGIIYFFFLIVAFVYWGKYDKKVTNFLGLLFLQAFFMPFYSRILHKKINNPYYD